MSVKLKIKNILLLYSKDQSIVINAKRDSNDTEIQTKKQYYIKKVRVQWNLRNSHLDVFLGKGVLKICSKFTGEHPCRSATSL